MKDELVGKITTKFVGLRPKTYSYLMYDNGIDKKAKETMKCILKQRLKFKNYKKCLQNNKIILGS